MTARLTHNYMFAILPRNGAPHGAAGVGDGAAGIQVDRRTGVVAHRDLGQIEPTELDGITVNRTKGKTSPFVRIVKTKTFSSNSGTHTGFAVEVEDKSSPTGFAHVGNVGPRYLLLTNEEVRALAVEIAVQSGLPFRESRIFWDGSRFAHILDFVDVSEAVVDGDEVGLSLITRSSYDRSWRYECALMGRRFVCDNGVISGEYFARVGFKHLQSASGDDEADQSETWKDIVRQGMTVIDHAPEDLHRFVSGLRRLKQARMTDARLREFWRLVPELGDSVKGQILGRYVASEEPTMYGLFQAGTAVFSHREKMTASDFANNDVFSTKLLSYAFERLN